MMPASPQWRRYEACMSCCFYALCVESNETCPCEDMMYSEEIELISDGWDEMSYRKYTER